MLKLLGVFLRGPRLKDARILTGGQFDSGDVRIGDLLPFVGGCPRYPGDRCDLTGGHDAVIREFKGELYYQILS